MRTVYLHGALGEEFGRKFDLEVESVREAVRCFEANFPGRFYKALVDDAYHLVRGDMINPDYLSQDQVMLNLGNKDIHIIPVAAGAGGGGRGKSIGRIVLGVALIAFAAYAAPMAVGSLGPMAGTAELAVAGGAVNFGATAFSLGGMGISYSQIAMFGVSMALGGVANMLAPTPEVNNYEARESADQRRSFLFNGATNTTEQGGPIPILYGRMRVGSTVLSGGISTEKVTEE